MKTEHNIVIVGVGALGSHLMLFARNFEARFTVIDFDHTETKNIMSQFHTKMSNGKNKAQALQQTMQALFSIKINAIPHKLTKDNVKTLLGPATIIVDCLDNAVSRKLVQDFARENNIPCLHGALAAGGAFGSVLWSENFIIDSEGQAGQATCEDGEHLPFISTVAVEMASTLQRFMKTSQKDNCHFFPNGKIKI